MFVIQPLKILHELGSVGLMGAFLVCIVVAADALAWPPAHYASLRATIDVVGRYVLLPSLALVLVSGLLAMAVHPPFHNAGWAWMKVATTVLVLEGTFGVQARARDITALAVKAAAGEGDAAQMAALLKSERGALWALLAVSAANIVLGVWRPRFRKRRVDPAIKRAVQEEAAARDDD